MGDKIAVFALLCSVAAVVFGVLRYRHVRAEAKAAAQDRLSTWVAEMSTFTPTGHADAVPGTETGTETGTESGAEPDAEPDVEPDVEPADAEPDVEPADVQPDGETGVEPGGDVPAQPDVRAEMDAFFGAGPTPPAVAQRD